MPGGFFITLEGGEGAGKSTQARRLVEKLKSLGRECVLTREPGGSTGAEEIRKLLVTGATDRWSANAESLLNYAARDDHLRQTIKPALADGQIVICDRFYDSTRAYQGAAGGASQKLLACLESEIVGSQTPDLTIIFDLDPETGLKRTGSRNDDNEDRFERKQIKFHTTLRQAFLDIAKAEPDRCAITDAAMNEDQVFDAIWTIVAQRLGLT